MTATMKMPMADSPWKRSWSRRARARVEVAGAMALPSSKMTPAREGDELADFVDGDVAAFGAEVEVDPCRVRFRRCSGRHRWRG